MTQENPELQARLDLLASEKPEFDGDQRLLASGDPFDAVMKLIDQTVIPSVLEISDGETTFLIEAFGRRVCRLPGRIDELTASDTTGVAEATRLILEFTDNVKGPLKVRDLASTASQFDPAQSVSIKDIAAAADRGLIEANLAPMAQFRAQLGDAIVASVSIEGDASDQRSGGGDLCADLEQDFLELAASARQSDEPRLILFETSENNGSVRGLACVEKEAFIFETKNKSTAKIAALFDQSIGS